MRNRWLPALLALALLAPALLAQAGDADRWLAEIQKAKDYNLKSDYISFENTLDCIPGADELRNLKVPEQSVQSLLELERFRSENNPPSETLQRLTQQLQAVKAKSPAALTEADMKAVADILETMRIDGKMRNRLYEEASGYADQVKLEVYKTRKTIPPEATARLDSLRQQLLATKLVVKTADGYTVNNIEQIFRDTRTSQAFSRFLTTSIEYVAGDYIVDESLKDYQKLYRTMLVGYVTSSAKMFDRAKAQTANIKRYNREVDSLKQAVAYFVNVIRMENELWDVVRSPASAAEMAGSLSPDSMADAKNAALGNLVTAMAFIMDSIKAEASADPHWGQNNWDRCLHIRRLCNALSDVKGDDPRIAAIRGKAASMLQELEAIKEQNTVSVGLASLPAGVALGDSSLVRYDPVQKKLYCWGEMSKEQMGALMTMSTDENYRKAVMGLYQLSQRSRPGLYLFIVIVLVVAAAGAIILLKRPKPKPVEAARTI